MYKLYFKRFLDLVVSSLLLMVLSPLLISIALLLRITKGWNPFFIQTRPGKYGKPFRLIKFRTMKNVKNIGGTIIHDIERVTLIGRFLRAFSLDELPQLVNVIKGDMSLIGPRPLLMEYLSLYNDYQSRRNEVKPGITGWAQVNGRKGIMFSKRFELDVWYVDHISFALDFKIFWLTIIKIIMRENNPAGKLVLDVDDVGFRKRLGITKSSVS